MILKEFLENPAGKGDSSVNRTALRSLLDSKYNKLVDQKKITHKIYKVLNRDAYYIHVIIPTETERDNSYDVVFYFYDETGTNNDLSLLNYSIQIFCNAPSFAYTFAKVYDNEGLMVPTLKDKYPKEIFQFSPETRNRYGMVNYDKYAYFGAKYIYESRILNKTTIGLRSISYSPIVLNHDVRSLDVIMNQYNKAKNKLKRTKEKETTQDKQKTSQRTVTSNGIVQKKKPINKAQNKVKSMKPKKNLRKK